MKPRRLSRAAPALLALLVARSGEAAKPGAPSSAPTPGVVRLHPGLTAAELAKHADTESVELSNGMRLQLGSIRRLRGALRRPPASRSAAPAAMTRRAAAKGTLVQDARGLAQSLARSESETVVLPSGRRTTVAALRYMQPEVERRLGRPLSAAAARPDLSGPAVQVDASADWKAILQMPDTTVLVTAGATRITVGELKQRLAP